MYFNEEPRVAIYLRVSTHYQVDKDSLPMQREDLINYCKYVFNTDNYEVFEDAGYSGKDTGRPAFQEMMAKIRKKKFTHILVWKIDRISRNLLDFSKMYEELKKYEVTFVSKNEQFDTSTAMGEAMLKIILVFAELERKLTSERVSATMLSRATKGLWNGANVPLGYEWNEEEKFPTPNDDETITVNLVYKKYIELKSCSKVAKYLNDNQISTKRGGNWTSKTVCDILRNPFYKGTYRYNYRESARGKIKPKNEWILIENNHQPIIDTDIWNKCNKILDANSDINKSEYRQIKHIHIFSKKMICSNCGNSYIASKDRERVDGYTPSKYRCSGKVHKHICDAKLATDVYIGEFIFSLLHNIIEASNRFITTVESLERILLNNDIFEDVTSINLEDLEILYLAMYKINKNTSTLSIKTIQGDNEEVSNKKNENKVFEQKIKKYNSDIKKYRKALVRLEELYLFADESMNKSDYIKRKNEFEANIKKSEQELQKFYKLHSSAIETTNLEFLTSFETFFFNENFKDNFSFKELCMNINNNILKDMINIIISKIIVSGNIINEIKFNNGMKLRFNY